jgi:signal transduction histidine kinase
VATLSFAGLALAVSAILAYGTYLTARHYLIGQREQSAARQAFADASVVRDGLLTSGAEVSEVLGSISPAAGSVVLLHRNGQWYSSSLSVGADAVPPTLRQEVEGGGAAVSWGRTGAGPVVVVGLPLPAIDGEFFEVAPTSELDSTLTTLGSVLAVFAFLTTVGGALIGRAATARVVSPLDDIATAAARIAAGEMDTRLAPTEDPDLTVIVGSFNAMVEALEERVERDARFAADVSHELRSPVTTLMTSVEVLSAAERELPEASRQALRLVAGEVARLRRSLEHLLELARLEAGASSREESVVEIGDLVAHTLLDSRRAGVHVARSDAGVSVRGDKMQLRRALLNLFDNADLHGGGLTAVEVLAWGGSARVLVDDRGEGVPPEERERIFERFARAGSRGSRTGTGLGLSLVAETARTHGGAAWCEASPGGGARFVLSLPLAGATSPEDGR